jgi:hypothetical protein
MLEDEYVLLTSYNMFTARIPLPPHYLNIYFDSIPPHRCCISTDLLPVECTTTAAAVGRCFPAAFFNALSKLSILGMEGRIFETISVDGGDCDRSSSVLRVARSPPSPITANNTIEYMSKRGNKGSELRYYIQTHMTSVSSFESPIPLPSLHP